MIKILKTFNLVFAGDTSLGESYISKGKDKLLKERLKNEPNSFFSGVEHLVSESDFFILNFETILSEPFLKPVEGKKYTNHDKKSSSLACLKKLNVTGVNLANNHTLDFGTKPMLRTKKTLEKESIKCFGVGENKDNASKYIVLELQGQKETKNVYILGWMLAGKKYYEEYNFFATKQKPGITPSKYEDVANEISQIRKSDSAAIIIVYPHWQGFDYKYASENYFVKNICKEFIDSGANLIIGHGPHMLNHIERYKSGIIAYSIGNFIFNSPGRYKKLNAPPYSLVACLQITEENLNWNINCRFYPIITDNKRTKYNSRTLMQSEKQKFEHFINSKLSTDDSISTNILANNLGIYLEENLAPIKKINDKVFNEQWLQKQLPKDLPLNSYNTKDLVNNQLVKDEFERLGYKTRSIKKYLFVTIKEKDYIFTHGETPFTSRTGARALSDKIVARQMLSEIGVSIAKGRHFSIDEKEQALDFALNISSAIVKPYNGKKGKGVSVGIKTKEEFETAWNYAVKTKSKLILIEEEFQEASEARYLVVNGSCIAVLRKIPPHVIGDGKTTVEELVAKKNQAKKNNPVLCNSLINLDNHRIAIIKKQSFDLTSVPENGKVVLLDFKASISAGGDTADITSIAHSSFKKMCEKISTTFEGLDVLGVDILAKDHSIEANDSNYIVIEANTCPGLNIHHYPAYGASQNVAKEIVEYVLNKETLKK